MMVKTAGTLREDQEKGRKSQQTDLDRQRLVDLDDMRGATFAELAVAPGAT